MKSGNNNINKNPQGTPQLNKKSRAPEIRDNLDSRKKQEQKSKGGDGTHNQKDQRNPSDRKNKG